MKRITIVTVLLACGFLAAGTPLFAQTAAPEPPANWFTGKATLLLLGRDDVDSAKFEEYREVPKGISLPVLNLQGGYKGNDFALFGQKIAQSDQRFTGYANVAWFDVRFDYNQIPHNMAYDGQTLFAETSPGVWNMNATLRQALGAAVDAVPTASRTYPFYADLLAPTIASANSIDITSQRNRGEYVFEFGKSLPFDLSFAYMRETKTGYRGASGGDILGTVTSAVDVGETINETTQDFGIRAAFNFKYGNAYAKFNRNIYNDDVDALVIDNPFRATDFPYTSTSAPGGPAQARFSTAPDNEASREAFGALLKFGLQTRITGDIAFGQWTQDAAFLPYTINSVVFSPAGAPANSVSTLQQKSLNGKVNTTSVNLGFSSRPIPGLGIRARYRYYDLSDKSSKWVITGDVAGSPDRSWSVVTPSTDAPFGHATANPYENTTSRFDAQVSYDFADLTVEGSVRAATLDRTYREATSGSENGWGLAAIYRTSDWLRLRAFVDDASRSAEGHTVYGFQMDEAERDSTRVGLDVNITPLEKFDFGFTYYRRNDDYPNRPDRIAVSGGVPIAGAQPIAGTPSGLLEASYDTYTLDFGYTPSERAEITAYYTYEKNLSTNQWSTTTAATATPPLSLNNLLNYKGTDRGDTFGATARFDIVPEKWTFSFLLSHQKVDGLMDITANETGSFYNPGRTTLIPSGQGGAADIVDYDDTKLTTVVADLAYAVAKAWTLSFGYAYEEYSHADAFSDGNTIFPQSVLFFLKGNDGGYKVNVAYAKLNYRF
jgi:hypothetical protein